METQLYSIFDVKAVRFLKLFQAENHAVAIRGFVDGASQNPDIKRHAGDYQLMHLGSMNIESGRIIPVEHAYSLGTLSSYLMPDQPQMEVK